ncbi:PAS domain-containing protein [Spirosoma sp. KNUC1025]|uniref:PAS domain-containing protein n=1 Tax=Spirosoma sp. KNUC1025 TaxID=2894082 RepID=UPI00386E24CE|nr:PAS domain-containing protein [Spirosoma sp. KNUC1025]
MKDLLQHWFDTSPQGGAILEPVRNDQGEITDFRYQLINKALAQLHKRTQKEIAGRCLKEVFSPARASVLLQRSLAAISSSNPCHYHEHYMQEDTGIWISTTLTRTTDKDLILVNVQIIDEQKKSEHDLERRLAMESTISAISSRFITLKAHEVDTYIVEALGHISKYIDAERASVFLYSEDYQEGRCQHEWSAPESAPERIKSRPDPVSVSTGCGQNCQMVRLYACKLIS